MSTWLWLAGYKTDLNGLWTTITSSSSRSTHHRLRHNITKKPNLTPKRPSIWTPVTIVPTVLGTTSGVKVGGNAVSILPFCNLAFPGVRALFPRKRWKRTFLGRKDKFHPWERKFSNELVNLNLVKTTTRHRFTERVCCKTGENPQILTGAQGFLSVPLP